MFLDQRSLVPKGNLYEMSFDTLTRDPLGAVQTRYRELSLQGFVQQVYLLLSKLLQEINVYDTPLYKHA